jgi:uncharacterized protein (TIGR03067 family)
MTRLVFGLWVICLWAFSIGRPAPAAPGPKDKGDPESAALQGTWEWDPEAARSDAVPPVHLERVVVKGDTLTFHYRTADGQITSVNTFALNPRAAPKRIDFANADGPRKGLMYVGLYELADGKLRICYRGPESTRPADFDDKKDGNNCSVFVSLVRPPAGK